MKVVFATGEEWEVEETDLRTIPYFQTCLSFGVRNETIILPEDLSPKRLTRLLALGKGDASELELTTRAAKEAVRKFKQDLEYYFPDPARPPDLTLPKLPHKELWPLLAPYHLRVHDPNLNLLSNHDRREYTKVALKWGTLSEQTRVRLAVKYLESEDYSLFDRLYQENLSQVLYDRLSDSPLPAPLAKTLRYLQGKGIRPISLTGTIQISYDYRGPSYFSPERLKNAAWVQFLLEEQQDIAPYNYCWISVLRAGLIHSLPGTDLLRLSLFLLELLATIPDSLFETWLSAHAQFSLTEYSTLWKGLAKRTDLNLYSGLLFNYLSLRAPKMDDNLQLAIRLIVPRFTRSTFRSWLGYSVEGSYLRFLPPLNPPWSLSTDEDTSDYFDELTFSRYLDLREDYDFAPHLAFFRSLPPLEYPEIQQILVLMEDRAHLSPLAETPDLQLHFPTFFLIYREKYAVGKYLNQQLSALTANERRMASQLGFTLTPPSPEFPWSFALYAHYCNFGVHPAGFLVHPREGRSLAFARYSEESMIKERKNWQKHHPEYLLLGETEYPLQLADLSLLIQLGLELE